MAQILISTLKEELKTAQRLERKYGAQLKTLPLGSFVLRTLKGKQYGYLTLRKKGKMSQKYLGSLKEEEIHKYREAIQTKRQVKQRLKKIREQIIILERALRGKAK